jgi:hypothetical protein
MPPAGVIHLSALCEYVGAIHLHSCYSDGSGTMREITASAGRAGLDYVVLTDHDTLRPREDRWQGWHDGILLATGVEITCRGRSHVVALGAAEVANLQFKPLRRVLFDLQNQGAAAFVAHAHPAHIMGISLKAGELLDWEIPGFTGVELWSFMHDICSGLTPWRIPSFVYTWPRYIRGPHPDTIAHWDRVTKARRFVAIGSLDNHALALPVLGRQVLSYEEGFRTLRTHVLSREWSGSAADAALLADALCQGRAFLALDFAADARGFRFEADAPGETLQMGEERPWAGPTVLRVHSPAPASLAILRGGRPVAAADAADLEFRAEEPGVYRAEARLKGRPWVYTNPVYLRQAPDGTPAK